MKRRTVPQSVLPSAGSRDKHMPFGADQSDATPPPPPTLLSTWPTKSVDSVVVNRVPPTLRRMTAALRDRMLVTLSSKLSARDRVLAPDPRRPDTRREPRRDPRRPPALPPRDTLGMKAVLPVDVESSKSGPAACDAWPEVASHHQTGV